MNNEELHMINDLTDMLTRMLCILGVIDFDTECEMWEPLEKYWQKRWDIDKVQNG